MAETERLGLDLDDLRRLSVAASGLAEPRLPATSRGIMEVVRTLGRIQLDPTNAVAPSHLLVLWSRLGKFDQGTLEDLRWNGRQLFELDAFMVPTADHPIFRAAMAMTARGETAYAAAGQAWIDENQRLRRHILEELEQRGSLATGAFEDLADRAWSSTGWTNQRNVSRMLELLARRGEVMVGGREKAQRLWDLPDRWLPAAVPRDPLTFADGLGGWIERVVRARGATPMPQTPPHPRAPWPFGGLESEPVVAATRPLVESGRLVPVAVAGPKGQLRGDWYIHADHLTTLKRLRRSRDETKASRTTLLSPFDPLITDRDKVKLLFDFDYKLEMYAPAAKREYGYYVLPILHGGRLIGRIDPKLDRKRRVLVTNAVFAEKSAPSDRNVGEAVAGAIADLAAFVGAERIELGNRLPRGWASALKRLS
ncbi:MAG: winged helix-turn-helix domain-containing protein [Candidatus Limnocylindria bacterium]